MSRGRVVNSFLHCGGRQFIGTSIQRLLRNIGVTGPKLKKASKDLAEEAERVSFWLRRKDMSRGK